MWNVIIKSLENIFIDLINLNNIENIWYGVCYNMENLVIGSKFYLIFYLKKEYIKDFVSIYKVYIL